MIDELARRSALTTAECSFISDVELAIDSLELTFDGSLDIMLSDQTMRLLRPIAAAFVDRVWPIVKNAVRVQMELKASP